MLRCQGNVYNSANWAEMRDEFHKETGFLFVNEFQKAQSFAYTAKGTKFNLGDLTISTH